MSVEVLNEWRLPIEERTSRKTRLGGGDYSLRTSALPPRLSVCFQITSKRLNRSGLFLCGNSQYLRECIWIVKDENLKEKMSTFIIFQNTPIENNKKW